MNNNRIAAIVGLVLTLIALALASSERPADASGIGASVISATGSGHSCAVTTAGGAKCWGANGAGELGNGSTTTTNTPVNVSGLASGVSSIGTGASHSCAFTTAGGVKCWGDGYWITPIDVAGLTSGVSSLSVGLGHTCAVTTSGGAKCWGYNANGELGDGTTTTTFTPVDVSGLTSGVASISAGWYYTCAVTTSGGVKCWGDNFYGQLGDGTTTSSLTPVDVSGLSSGVSQVSAGGAHSCARTDSGGLKCWGDNTWGQLGDGTTTDSTTPVDVSGLTSGASTVSTGDAHTCARTASAGAKCWGLNFDGELGNGTNTDSTTPVNVSGLAGNVAMISAGDLHTCAVTLDDEAKCWGENGSGQLGDFSNSDRNTPTDVYGLTPKPNTPAGTDVVVSPGSGVTLTFDEVTAGGNTTVSTSASGPGAPSGFQFGSPPVYYLISTTATFTGNVKVCITYTGSLTSSATEASMRLFHGTGGSGWDNITNDKSPAPNPDVDNDIICGVTTSFSPFAPAELVPTGDFDQDGCANEAELQTGSGAQVTGGRRNPYRFWDFFDTPDASTNVRDKSVAGTDFFRILARFGSNDDDGEAVINRDTDPLSAPPAPPAYHPAYDRGASSGPNAWNLTAANGAIAGTDFFAVLAQFGHACA